MVKINGDNLSSFENKTNAISFADFHSIDRGCVR
jgi:hypothetical protein